MQLTLSDFSMAGFTFRQTQRLERIQKLTAEDFITEASRDLPDTTTCEGDLRDPRCPVSGNGDVTNILLAAFNEKRELKGALHFGAINLIEKRGETLVVETHATPAFPGLNATEIAVFVSTAARFVLSSDLKSFEGPTLQIRGINYALEIPFKLGGKFEAMHNAVMGPDFEFETKDDDTRPGRKLHSIKPRTRVRAPGIRIR